MSNTLWAGLIAWTLWPALRARADESADIRALIRIEATRQHVSERVALAFADDESGLHNIVGDNHRPDPLKRAYGPFQLQARFHLRHGERPAKLLRLDVNVERGVAAIKQALALAEGDVLVARFMYVCGRRFKKGCSNKRRTEIKDSWLLAWERWRPRAQLMPSENSLCYVRRTDKERTRWQSRRNAARPK